MQKKPRNTIAKQEILSLISSTNHALSHIEIQQKLNNICDRVTIYRVLSRLVDEQKVHKIINTDGVVNYAACKSTCEHQHAHNHVHFSCNQCKEITCVENVVPQFSMSTEYKVEEINITVSGICPRCK